MTLILSLITEHSCVQVADRLVTTKNHSGVRPFDSKSNKTIVFHATDGIASLSYTGSAYVHDTPTDSWIAEKLNGTEHPFDVRSRPFFIRSGIRRTRWDTMGMALQNLAAEFSKMDSIRQSRIQSLPVTVAVCGWLWYRKKRPRPFLAEIVRTKPGSYVVKWERRDYGYYLVQSTHPSGYLRQADFGKLEKSFREHRANINEITEILIGTIRSVAIREATVGADCMMVSISHPYSPERVVSTKFFRSGPADQLISVKAASAFVAYSPWVVGPTQCMQPNVLIGGSTLELDVGVFRLVLTGPSVAVPPGPNRNAFEVGPILRPSFP